MVVVLALPILVLMTSHIFAIDIGLAPGLSPKNAALYLATVVVILRYVVAGGFRMQMGRFFGTYAAFLIYAISTWIIVGMFVQYKGYDMLKSGINLKITLMDPLIFFATFLFGPRSTEEAIKVLKVMLFAFIMINIADIGDAFHIFSFASYVDEKDYSYGRMSGPLGEPNQYGAYIAVFLPALFAAMLESKGLARLWWLFGIAVSFAALLTTASRGGFLAVLASGLGGWFLLRRYLPAKKMMAWAGGAILGVVIIVAIVSIQFGELLRERVIGESHSADVATISSGRTQFWTEAIEKMTSAPWTFFTGFGFDSYETMGFLFAPHNSYLNMWFNLGIPGLVLFTSALGILLSETFSSLKTATSVVGTYLNAFVFSEVALFVGLFFVELYTPWPYIWAFAGVMMRLVVNARQKVPEPESAGAQSARGAASLPQVRAVARR